MKLSVVVLLGVATLVSCAPQEYTPEAEVVPSVSTGGDGADGAGGDDYDYGPDYGSDYGPDYGFPPRRVLILTSHPDETPGGFFTMRNFFPNLFSVFGLGGRGDGDDQPAADGDAPPSLFPFLPSFPGINPDDFPDNYDNSTHHVHDVNGTAVEVNQTITKNTNEDGTFFHHVHLVRFVPGHDAGAGTGGQDGTVPEVAEEVPQEVPQEDPAKNQKPLRRRRRWLANFARSVVGDLWFRYLSPQSSKAEELGELEQLGEIRAPQLSYEGDTDVNYRTSSVRDEPDAQDFKAMSMQRHPKR
ncbi:uncharacterized protein LOC122244356 isoform X2 [Penaeus japonicus]|uniref:uncharacterized protein LOC122244356 isoform X2 n=1 Tax=Penaeus japonicus TaxID=27405 RepID=UPI001C715D5B|nr:uncharacterized protein LOC122244356 isoform X2 [Penaeus japonicus]